MHSAGSLLSPPSPHPLGLLVPLLSPLAAPLALLATLLALACSLGLAAAASLSRYTLALVRWGQWVLRLKYSIC